MYANKMAYETGSFEERKYLNQIEMEYQDRKGSLKEKVAETITDIYKFVFKPQPIEKIRLEQLVKNNNPETVLELGAGNDNIYERIIRDSTIRRYIRSDLSANQLNQIQDSRVENITYDGITLPLENMSVDVVLSKCVLHHIDNGSKEGRLKNRINFLKEKKRLIKDNGRVYCMDVYNPYKNNIKGIMWHVLKHRMILREEEHNFLTTEEAIDLFKKAEFNDIKAEEIDTYKGKYFVLSGGKWDGSWD